MKALLILAVVFTGCVTTAKFQKEQAVIIAESSGFKIDKYVVSASHVAKSDTVLIVDYWGKECMGLVVARDTINDIALIAYPNAKFVDYTTATVLARESIFSIGSPMGLFFTESEGKVQNVERTDDIVTYIQIGIDVGWGSSGSPVYDGKQRLVGMIVRAIPGTRFTFMTDIQNIVLLINKTKRQ